MLSDITFGITAFERPRHVARLVRSILQHYPRAQILLADNGRNKCPGLPRQVRQLDVPFDCGLSRARNALIDALETPYLLLLEEDFLFTSETRIEALLDVLEHDPEVGVVGGAIRNVEGRVNHYCMDLEVFRKAMIVREARHRVRFTARGLPYWLCDMCWNFALFRRDMLREHRWHDPLKVGEHAAYFHDVKQAAQWRVACCPSVVCFHATCHRSDEYLTYRRRAQALFQGYLREQGLERYERVSEATTFADDALLNPNVVVLGVGHSGTSVLTRMLHALGWQPADADEEFAESVTVRTLNQHARRTGALPAAPARRFLQTLPAPWAVKDPRFVHTLQHWLPHFQQLARPPLLMRIVRDTEHVAASYARRAYDGDPLTLVREREQLCQAQYERWPWEKLTVHYESLAHATAQFRPPPPPTGDALRQLLAVPGARRPVRAQPLPDDEVHHLDEEDGSPRGLSWAEGSGPMLTAGDGSGEAFYGDAYGSFADGSFAEGSGPGFEDSV